MTLVSGLRDTPIDEKLIAFGEVGLSGEIRSVSRVQARVNEAARLGFTQCILPKSCIKQITKKPDGIELIGVRNIKEALSIIR
jgi:DNA repair protein RadA/Sms